MDKYKKTDTQRFLARLIEIDASHSFDKNLIYIYDFGDKTQVLTTDKSKVKHQYVEAGVYEISVTILNGYIWE